MSNIRFWLDMDHRNTPKRSDKLIIGNIDTGQTMYIDLAELLNALSTNDLAESATRKFITPELLTKLENLGGSNYTLQQLQQYFYPKSSNPAGYLTADSSLQAAKISGILAASKIPDLDAAKIVSGTFGASRIPGLPASKITSGVFDVNRIPTLPASKIEGFALDLAKYILKTDIGAANGVAPLDANVKVPVGHIPNIDAGKITSGILDEARFSSILVKVSQIIDNLFSEDDLAPLSANQGRVLKGLIDEAATNIPDIIDNLESSDVESSLSANQGRVLMSLITGIQNILGSDDTTLDEFQEIVNFIKANKQDLQNLSIPNIAGLVDALAGKEPVFTKRSGFNNSFGSTSGTVAQGNDPRFQKGETAYSWGNHAGAGYETPTGAQIKANTAERNAKDYADTLDNNRTVIKKANITTYPSVVDDFSKNLLEFTANAGEVIDVTITKDLVLSGGLQAISTGNNQLKPVGGTDVTLIFPDGSGDKTIPKGMLSILATGTPNVYKIDGSLESLESGGSNITNLNEIATRNYSDLQGIPTTFTPKSHGHDWSEIGNKPSGYTPSPHNHEWSEIGNKPSFFSGFYIATGDAQGSRAYIQNLGTTLFFAGTNMSIARDGNNFVFNATGGGGSEVTNLNQIATRNYSDLQNKPSSFPPTTHSHTLAQIPKVVVDVTINQSNGNLIVHYSNGTSVERSFGTINANKFTE